MTLDRFGTRLDDYLEGTLPAAERRELEEHLAASAAARAELDETRRLLADLAALPESIEPERDLFPTIEARIDAAGGAAARRRPWLLLAAGLAAALGLVYLTARGPSPAAAPASPAATAAATATAPARPALATATSRAEDDLVAATDRLRRALDENRAALPPETRRLVERNLEIIQAAIAEIQLALDREPGNPELNRALVAYYQHELALLEQVNRAASRL